jgi:UDP:flavonoid glycosyltransferase YjiC (YdhE family)
MRLLFSFAGGSGHLVPLVPIARAAADAGHVVAFAGRPRMLPEVEALGFAAFAAGSDVGLAPRRLPLAEVDVEREIRAVGAGFGRRIARERAADLLPLCRAFRPDLLVCEELDFGAMVVAERLALPHATVLVSAAGNFVRPEIVAGPLDEVRKEHGLPADPALEALGRHLVLSPFPPSFRDPARPLPATAHGFRPLISEPTRAPAPRVSTRPGAPVVYFTLGTVFNMESGDLFTRVLAGLRELPVDVVVTVGHSIDPGELGPQPAHVHVLRHLAQESIMAHCSLVVSHGGSGSLIGALAHGRPSVLIPMGADQPLNAARAVELGVARRLDPIAATPESVRAAASAVLADPGYRRAAERVRDEFAALPGPSHAVRLLERLAAERRPLEPFA